jgi:tetratricopeptide (TPR) repeat protein
VSGVNGTNTLVCLHYLATVYLATGRVEAGERLLRDLLVQERGVLGPGHKRTLATMTTLVALCGGRGQYQEAAALAEDGLRLSRETLGLGHSQTLQLLSDLARARRGLGDVEGAAELLRQAVDVKRRVFGPDHPGLYVDLRELVNLDGAIGRWAECVELSRESLQHWSEGGFAPLYDMVGRGMAAALLAGDSNAFHQFLGFLEEHAPSTNDAFYPFWTRNVCLFCFLLPQRAGELAASLRLAQGIKAEHASLGWDKLAKGMAAYRSGNLEEALEWFQGWRQFGLSSAASMAGYFSAMVYYQQGDKQAANAALAEASRRRAMFLRSGLHTWNWVEYVGSATVGAEAEKMILGQTVTPAVTPAELASAHQQWLGVLHYMESAGGLARLNRWSEARDQFPAAVRQPAFDWEAFFSTGAWPSQIGSTLLRAGDLRGCGEFYQRIFSYFAKYSYPGWTCCALRACLARDWGTNLELEREVLKWHHALQADPGERGPFGIFENDLCMELAMAAYRLGHYDEVVEQSRATPYTGVADRNLARIFRAMGLAKLGRWDTAKQALHLAEAELRQPLAALSPGYWWGLDQHQDTHFSNHTGDAWWDLALCQVALDEAHRVFGQTQQSIVKRD